MVGIETPDVLAIASCDQPNSSRAALICLTDTFCIDKRYSRFIFDTISIAQGDNNCKGAKHDKTTFQTEYFLGAFARPENRRLRYGQVRERQVSFRGKHGRSGALLR
jgi:hypothetical protein